MPGTQRPFALAEDGTPPWEQQPGESKAMYQRFRFYLDWPTIPRRLPDVAQVLSKQDVRNVTVKSIIAYAKRYLWTDRALAYDDHHRAQRADEEADKRLTNAERVQKEQLEAATAIRRNVMEEILTRPLEAASLRDLRELLKLAFETEWRVLGLDRKQVQLSTANGEPLVFSFEGLGPDERAANLDETVRELAERRQRLLRAQDDNAD